jgi:hypothetical protein
MQIRIFTIPVMGGEALTAEMNVLFHFEPLPNNAKPSAPPPLKGGRGDEKRRL